MSAVSIPLEVYDLLERRLGRDDAMAVAKSIEASLSHIEERSREIATQRKLEAKDELKTELRQELATKEDLANLRAELKEDIANVMLELKEDIARVELKLSQDIARLDRKFTVFWMITIFTVVFLNQKALTFLARSLSA